MNPAVPAYAKAPAPGAGLAAAMAAVVLACPATPANAAAEWTFNPRLEVTGEYNDNSRLSADDEPSIEVAGVGIDALVGLTARTPRTEFTLTPRLRYTFFPGDEEEEEENQFLQMNWQGRSERSTAMLNASYQSLTTIGRYFPDSSFGEDDSLGNPDSGEGVSPTTGRNTEDRFSIRPSLDFELRERHQLGLGVEYLDVDYDNQGIEDRAGFRWLRGDVGYDYRWTETGSIGVGLNYSTFESEDEPGSTNSFGLDAQWTQRRSETAEYFFRAGITRVEVGDDDGGKKTWENGYSGGIGVRWRFEVTTLFADLTSYLDPSTEGEMISREQLRLGLTRRMSETLTLTAGARWIRDDGAVDESNFVPREYANASLGFEWRASRVLSMIGRYVYQWREDEGAVSDADANLFSVGFVYRPKAR